MELQNNKGEIPLKVSVGFTIFVQLLTELQIRCFFSQKVLIFFLFFDKTCCGYSLEVPQRGASNGYPHVFVKK